ncbi:MAG: hypothetical protein EBR93_02510, partial [Bacteroidetes bacterium]|nr:hypothetical protein [Bacteroidota bacterium]
MPCHGVEFRGNLNLIDFTLNYFHPETGYVMRDTIGGFIKKEQSMKSIGNVVCRWYARPFKRTPMGALMIRKFPERLETNVFTHNVFTPNVSYLCRSPLSRELSRMSSRMSSRLFNRVDGWTSGMHFHQPET